MSANMGRVVQVIGPVVDIEFPPERLPDLLTAIRIEGKRRPEDRFDRGSCPAPGNNMVRCIAMASTDGLQRGMQAVDLGGPITVPVGPETLGRLFNVLGQPIDGGPPWMVWPAGLFTAPRPRWMKWNRPRSCWRRGLRLWIFSLPIPGEARSASLAAQVWARPF